MADEFGHDVLIKVVAQICQMVGFERVMTSPIFILTDILRDYIRQLGRLAKGYGEHCGRCHVNLNDLSLAFHDHGIYPSELLKFLQVVGPLPQSLIVPKYPVTFGNQYSCRKNLENVQVNDSVTSRSTETLKIKISLSKIKEAGKPVKSKKKNKSKKMRKKNMS